MVCRNRNIIFEDGMGIQTDGRKDGQTEGEELSDPDIFDMLRNTING